MGDADVRQIVQDTVAEIRAHEQRAEIRLPLWRRAWEYLADAAWR
jgi:hypothetical protein